MKTFKFINTPSKSIFTPKTLLKTFNKICFGNKLFLISLILLTPILGLGQCPQPNIIDLHFAATGLSPNCVKIRPTSYTSLTTLFDNVILGGYELCDGGSLAEGWISEDGITFYNFDMGMYDRMGAQSCGSPCTILDHFVADDNGSGAPNCVTSAAENNMGCTQNSIANAAANSADLYLWTGMACGGQVLGTDKWHSDDEINWYFYSTSGMGTWGSSTTCASGCSEYTSGGSISGNQSNCGSFDPTTINNAGLPSGGSGGTNVYSWEVSSNNSTWSVIVGATSWSYDPGSITSTKYYRRAAYRCSSGGKQYSNTVTKTVNSVPTAEAGNNFTKTCSSNSSGATIGESSASGYTYSWSPTTGLSASNVAAPTANPSSTTTYTVTATKTATGCTATDDVTATVCNGFSAGSITTTGETIPYGGDPVTISSSSLPSGGAGTYSYQWHHSTDGGNNWSSVSGATNSSYDPGNLTTTTIYKRNDSDSQCGDSDASGTYTVTVNSNAYVSVASGNWNDGSSWLGGSVPPTGADVTISHDITLNITCTVGSLVIAASQTLSLNSISYSLYCSGSTTVNGTLSIGSGRYASNGVFDATNGSVTFTSNGILEIYDTVTSLGSFTRSTGTVGYRGGNQNVIGLSSSSGSSYYNLVIDGTGTKTLDGTSKIYGDLILTASTFDINGKTIYPKENITRTAGNLVASSASNITIDNSGSHNICEFSDNDITIKTTSTGGTVTTTGNIDCKKIDLQSGTKTFIIDGETVNVDVNLEIDAGTLQITSGELNINSNSGTSATINGGTLDIDGGTVTIGNSTAADLAMSSGTLDISNGTLNIVDELDVANGTVTQSGGIINIKSYVGSGNGSSADKFEMDAGTLNLTEGTLNLQGQKSGSTYDAMSIASGVTVNANASHTINVQSNNTSSNDEDMYISLNGHSIGNITVNLSGHTVYLEDEQTILGKVIVTAGTLDMGTGNTNIGNNFTYSGIDLSNATITFNGSSQQTVTSNGNTFGNVIINNSNGIVMQDAMTVIGSLTMTNGTINTNGNILELTSEITGNLSGYSENSFIIATTSDGALRRHINDDGVNTDTYTYPIGLSSSSTDYRRFDLVNDGLNGGGFNYLDVYIEKNTESGQNIASNSVADHFGEAIVYFSEEEWMMEPDLEPDNGEYGIRLYLADITMTGWALEDNKFTIVKRPTGSSNFNEFSCHNDHTTIPSIGSLGRTLSGGYAERSGFTDFSGSKVGGGEGELPIDLVYFNATVVDGIVDLNWTTQSEVNNDFFTVERSNDAINFEIVVTVPGAGTSNEILYYKSTDESPMMGVSYYRLKQTDYDGKFTYSKIVAVKYLQDLNFNIMPNPATERLTVTFGKIEGSTVFVMTPEYDAKIKIFNTEGELIYKKNFDGNYYKFNIDVSQFPKGIYFVSLLANNDLYKAKFVKQ